jgi:hypothetical protein
MAFRSRVFGLWPGFDERLGRGAIIDGGEEHNAFFSLLDRRHRIVRTSEAVVYHPTIRDFEGLRARHLKDLASGVAYITLLFFEQPLYRLSVIKYAIGALRGTARAWRLAATPQRRVASRAQMLRAVLSGPLLYGLSRLSRSEEAVLSPTSVESGAKSSARPRSTCEAPRSP